ncbi:unnamed protein product, partial [Discosporangium mesarthrocarpum]
KISSKWSTPKPETKVYEHAIARLVEPDCPMASFTHDDGEGESSIIELMQMMRGLQASFEQRAETVREEQERLLERIERLEDQGMQRHQEVVLHGEEVPTLPRTHGAPSASRESAPGERLHHTVSRTDAGRVEDDFTVERSSRPLNHRNVDPTPRFIKPKQSLFDGDKQKFPTWANDTLNVAGFYDCAWVLES